MNDEDERHRREEEARRAKRKALKASKSEAQKEKERKRKEHSQKVLQAQQQGGASGSATKKRKTGATPPPTTSGFTELFATRATGFQVDLRFRNAPPRPPVGPCFVGPSASIQTVLQERLCKSYQASNAVEAAYVWKLHTEPDLGVPLALSAMNPKLYQKNNKVPAANNSSLHPDDAALLDWKGGWGDSAADDKQRRVEAARASARRVLRNNPPNTHVAPPAAATARGGGPTKRKAFSRVLDESMQTWMKKTTYLSNDYTRKVHDFRSLAQTKQELASDLQARQAVMQERRSATAVAAGFANSISNLVHPTHKTLKPKRILPVLPFVDRWGLAHTHMVVDKPPTHLPTTGALRVQDFGRGYMGDVKQQALEGGGSRRSCQIYLPVHKKKDDDKEKDKDDDMDTKEETFQTAAAYDLDVVPLKQEDAPHNSFLFCLVDGTAQYLPLASRVLLSTGRPPVEWIQRGVQRREMTQKELEEMEERQAAVDQEMAEKHHVSFTTSKAATFVSRTAEAPKAAKDDDDGEDDYGDDDDDDSDDDQAFGGGTRTIVAEG